MVDIVDAATRNRMIAGIKSRDTKLSAGSPRLTRLPISVAVGQPAGKPDVVLPKWRTSLYSCTVVLALARVRIVKTTGQQCNFLA